MALRASVTAVGQYRYDEDESSPCQSVSHAKTSHLLTSIDAEDYLLLMLVSCTQSANRAEVAARGICRSLPEFINHLDIISILYLDHRASRLIYTKQQ